MFRGKKSSNRIEISRLVQDLLNFGVLGSLWLWGGTGGWGVSGGMEVSPHECTYMHMYTHTHMYMHTCKEIANGHPHGDIHVYHVYNMHVHVCVHACMGHPIPTPTQSTHPPPPRRTPRISKNLITLELIKIIRFCLKI